MSSKQILEEAMYNRFLCYLIISTENEILRDFSGKHPLSRGCFEKCPAGPLWRRALTLPFRPLPIAYKYGQNFHDNYHFSSEVHLHQTLPVQLP